MNREEIRNLTACPKCGAKKGEVCDYGAKPNTGGKNHVERLYRAQDIANGKPDRVTGQTNYDHDVKRRCPICRKRLKTHQGAIDHMYGAHSTPKEVARKMIKEAAEQNRAQQVPYRPQVVAEPEDFDVLEDF